MLLSLINIIIQTPAGTPNPGESEGIDLSNPFDLIVFIIIPILLVIFYFTYRKRNKK